MTSPQPRPEFTQWTMSDGYVIEGRVWRRPGPTVIYLHGIQSHGGWYEWSGGFLASLGCNVVMPDRRGSGLNREARGDATDPQRWLLDIEETLAVSRKQNSHPVVGLVGVSWGGKVAAAIAARNAQLLRGLLLITPGVFPAVDVSTLEKLKIAAALLSNPETLAPIPLNDPALFTDNPAGQQFISQDPLTLQRATARFFWHSKLLDREIQRWPRGKLTTPTTLVLCGRDRIIRNDATREWATRVTDGKASIKEFPDDVHTLEFNEDRSGFERVLREWTHGILDATAT